MSRIVSSERFKTAQELLTQPWGTRTFSQLRGGPHLMSQEVVTLFSSGSFPCDDVINPDVWYLSGVVSVSGGELEGGSHRRVKRDTIMPTPPTGYGQQSMLVFNDPVMRPERGILSISQGVSNGFRRFSFFLLVTLGLPRPPCLYNLGNTVHLFNTLRN